MKQRGLALINPHKPKTPSQGGVESHLSTRAEKATTKLASRGQSDMISIRSLKWKSNAKTPRRRA